MPAVTFEGSQYLEIPQVITKNSEYTVFAVEARNSSTSGPIISSFTRGVTLGYDGDTSLKALHSYDFPSTGTDWAVATVSSYSTLEPQILTFLSSKSSLTAQKSSVSIRSGRNVIASPRSTFLQGESSTYYIGYSYNNFNVNYKYYKGLIGEIIIYNRALRNSEIEDVVTYLSNKWNIKI